MWCIIYIVRRTQLYLEDDVWKILHARARGAGSTVSDLVRRAVREKYVGALDKRRAAMRAFIGIRAGRSEFADSDAYLRELRRGVRIQRAGEE